MISLIVPVYNVKPYINEFLNSVIAQTFTDFEVLLVDDGSTDGTQFILDEYAEKHDFFKVIHKENGGVVSAWKKGVYESKGELLAFADPDDVLAPTALETQYRLITEYNADLVITGITRLENGKTSTMPADRWSLDSGLYEGEKLEQIKKNLFGNKSNKNSIFFFAKWNKLFKRDVVLNNLKYSRDDVSFGDDVCICASAIYDSNRIYYSHEELYVYRIRSESITTVNFGKSQIDNIQNLVDGEKVLLKDKGYLTDFFYFNNLSYYILWLLRKIKESPANTTQKKEFLNTLKNHELIVSYDTKKAKNYISFKRYFAILLLKHSAFGLLLKLL